MCVCVCFCFFWDIMCVVWLSRFLVSKLTNCRPFRLPTGVALVLHRTWRNHQEAVRNRPTSQSAPCKVVLECVRNRSPPPPEGTPLQEWPTGLGQPSDPPPEVDEMGMEDQQRPQAGVDGNPPWRARERTLIKAMENVKTPGGNQ